MEARLKLQSVLIVEDDDGLRRTLARAVGEKYAVTTAKGGHEAVAVLRRQKIDVILLDLFMLKGDGFAVLSHLIARDTNQMVVILSALDDSRRIVNIMKLGVSDYLTKPCSLKALHRSIRRAIKSRHGGLHSGPVADHHDSRPVQAMSLA